MTLEEVYKGSERTLSVSRHEVCAACSGSRMEKGSKKKTCSSCRGAGEVRISQGFFTLRQACPHCHGEGEMLEKPCKECHGAGRVQKERKITIKVPAGIDHESRLRVTGEGEAGENGGSRGDLYVQIHIKPHSIFERRGDDLYCELLIPFTIAALGGTVTVPTLTAEEPLDIPAGTPAGKVFKIKDKGLPVLGRPHAFGLQYVRVDIDVPKKLDKDQKELLKLFAQKRGETAEVRKKGLFDRIKENFE